MPSSRIHGVTFCFTRRLPLVVTVRGVRWTIAYSYDLKGARADVSATGSNGKHGTFYSGRTGQVERMVRMGIFVPAGTVRYQIALALAAEGLATIDQRGTEV